jgi:hypothetical protein
MNHLGDLRKRHHILTAAHIGFGSAPKALSASSSVPLHGLWRPAGTGTEGLNSVERICTSARTMLLKYLSKYEIK